MNSPLGEAFVLDWDLDSEDESPHLEFGVPSLTKAKALDGSNREPITVSKPYESVPPDIAFPNLPGPGNATLFVDDDDDQMMAFDWDLEDMPQGSDPEDSTTDAHRRVLVGLENIVLSFLEQLGGNQIELTLVNRMKSKEDGSSTHRALSWPKRTSNANFRNFARLFRVVELVHEALITNIPTTKRDIYYKDVSLFKTQSVVDDLVDDLAATFEVSRGDLNVRASSKGLFCGSGLSIHLKQGGIIHGNDSEGALIPTGANISHLQVSENVSWVLIVEKEAVFQTLCGAGLASSPRCPGSGLIVTGKGYPDLATRELVSDLSRTLPLSIPLLALVDADAYGLDILSVYKFGSQSLSHEGIKATAPRIAWLGLWGSELSRLRIDRDNLIPLTKYDHKKALEMLRRSDTMMPIQWRKEISHMLHTRRKAEIEIISSAPNFVLPRNTSQDSRLQDLFENNDVAVDPPLVQYLAAKLYLWVNAI